MYTWLSNFLWNPVSLWTGRVIWTIGFALFSIWVTAKFLKTVWEGVEHIRFDRAERKLKKQMDEMERIIKYDLISILWSIKLSLPQSSFPIAPPTLENRRVSSDGETLTVGTDFWRILQMVVLWTHPEIGPIAKRVFQSHQHLDLLYLETLNVLGNRLRAWCDYDLDYEVRTKFSGTPVYKHMKECSDLYRLGRQLDGFSR